MFVFTTTLAAAVRAQPARTAPTPEARGKRLFLLVCQSCHAIAARATPKPGPNLYRIPGQRAATVPGFAYSQALRRSGIVWSDAALDRWLHKPSALVPGTSMTFQGVSKPEDRRALIAYMKQASR